LSGWDLERRRVRDSVKQRIGNDFSLSKFDGIFIVTERVQLQLISLVLYQRLEEQTVIPLGQEVRMHYLKRIAYNIILPLQSPETSKDLIIHSSTQNNLFKRILQLIL
jgi:hypothetical protein